MAFGSGKNQIKDLQEQIEVLNEENRLLRRKLRLLMGGDAGATLSISSMPNHLTLSSQAPTTDSGNLSIAGLDVAYIVVDPESRIIQINSRMCQFLGCDKSVTDRKAPVSDFDNLDWAPQVFCTLLDDAKSAGDSIPSEFEASRENLVTGQRETYHFKAVWSGKLGTVTMEDISQLTRTREFFERLVSPRIVTQLLDSGEDPFTVDKRRMTVLFGDLRSFTDFCEHSEPEQVREVFDEFFSLCMEAIDRNEATLDKFVGDQVMALFSAPVTDPTHSYQAIKVGVEIQRAMGKARQSWINRGLVPQSLLKSNPDILKLGIGINTGDMVVGMFGDQRSNQYTVLGHTVNLGARLCGNAAGEEILTGMETLNDVKKLYQDQPETFDLAFKFKSKGSLVVKGVAEPVPVTVVVY